MSEKSKAAIPWLADYLENTPDWPIRYPHGNRYRPEMEEPEMEEPEMDRREAVIKASQEFIGVVDQTLAGLYSPIDSLMLKARTYESLAAAVRALNDS